MSPYIILTSIHIRAPHALHSARSPAHQSISLQALVILNMLCKLAERITSGRTLCTTHKRHLGWYIERL